MLTSVSILVSIKECLVSLFTITQTPETIAFFSVTLVIILALIVDSIFGEAKRFHYLVGFGNIASVIEAKLNKGKTPALSFSISNALRGAIAWSLMVLPLPLLYFFFLNDLLWYWQVALDAIVLYLAIGLNSLRQHAMQVYQPLKKGDLAAARHFTGYLVSRETASLTPQQMSRATVESMLENGHDSVIASLIYYLIGGAPLVILHRFANTLDAMWGYKNPRFNSFGYASARLDDILGFITGKVSTVLYAIQGRLMTSLRNAYKQGNRYKSHNGGWVMSAGATVMGITLGGSASYHGKEMTSVTLGEGRAVEVEDIPRSITLVRKASWYLLLSIFIWQLICFIYTN